MRLNPSFAAVLAALSVAGPALAQERESPEEARHREQRQAAREAAREAWDLIESYGRVDPPKPPKPRPLRNDEARDRAIDRLARPLHPEPEIVREAERDEPIPFDVQSDYEGLKEMRRAILARLRRLDPKRFPLRRAPRTKAPARPRLKIFDVQDLTDRTVDYPAPNVGLGSGLDASGADIDSGEDDSNTPGVGLGGEKLLELVEGVCDEDAEGSIEFTSGRLIVRKAPEQLKRIEALLKTLREGRGGLLEIELRVYRMPSAFYSALNKSGSGLSDAEEAAIAAAVKRGEVRLLAAPRLVAHDGQKVHVRRGKSRSIISGLEVNQTGVVPTLNPLIANINEGLVVEARPILDRGRQLVLIDVGLSISRLSKSMETRLIQGSEVELPQMLISRTASTGKVPLGRGAILGGVLAAGPDDGRSLQCVIYARPRLIRARRR